MDFGIALAPGVDAWRWVRRAEELGFSHAWLYDTQLLMRGRLRRCGPGGSAH